MDVLDLDVPPGFPGGVDSPRDHDDAPPGFPLLGKLALGAKAKASSLRLDTNHQPRDDDVDVEDPFIKLYSGLQEQHDDVDLQRVTKGDTIYSTAKKFEDLPISDALLKGIYNEMKFEHPSRIQANTLPMILTPDDTGHYRDLVAQAQNGCGKTVCFVLAMLSRVDPDLREPQALCMCPTRELVVQTVDVVKKMAKYTNITIHSTAALEDSRGEIKEQIVVATHGRLKLWVARKQLSTKHVRVLVFDEGDQMLQQDAFEDDSVRLMKRIHKDNKDVQVLFFSATFRMGIRSFITRVAPQANMVFVPDSELSLEVIKQCNVRLPDWHMKADVLKKMIFPNCEKLGQTIIFVRARHSAHNLHSQLEAEGYKCTSITGEMDFAGRDRVIAEFREGATKVLIATDVLARGFDVSQVTLVINYDLPDTYKSSFDNACDKYLHRIGRSGRFGRKGAAFNFVCSDEVNIYIPKSDAALISDISKRFDITIPEIQYDDEAAFIDVLRRAGLTDVEA